MQTRGTIKGNTDLTSGGLRHQGIISYLDLDNFGTVFGTMMILPLFFAIKTT